MKVCIGQLLMEFKILFMTFDWPTLTTLGSTMCSSSSSGSCVRSAIASNRYLKFYRWIHNLFEAFVERLLACWLLICALHYALIQPNNLTQTKALKPAFGDAFRVLTYLRILPSSRHDCCSYCCSWLRANLYWMRCLCTNRTLSDGLVPADDIGKIFENNISLSPRLRRDFVYETWH